MVKPELIELLLDNQVKPEQVSKFSVNALHILCESNNETSLSNIVTLVDRCPQLLTQETEYLQTPLHVLTSVNLLSKFSKEYKRMCDISTLFIAYGVDLYSKDQFDNSPIETCENKAWNDTLAFYLENGTVWSTRTHFLFPKSFRDKSLAFVLALKIFAKNNLQFSIPKPLILIILEFASTSKPVFVEKKRKEVDSKSKKPKKAKRRKKFY